MHLARKNAETRIGRRSPQVHLTCPRRAGGTGIVIGFGRGGAALGPIVAGYMFEAQLGLQVVSIVMAAGSVVALFALLRLGPVPALPASPGSTG